MTVESPKNVVQIVRRVRNTGDVVTKLHYAPVVRERHNYRYAGPEVVYTFWAKYGPCSKPRCGHRKPVFCSPVIAEKKLGVKYIASTCKGCKTAFHAALGSARMAPAAERVELENEYPFTQQPCGCNQAFLHLDGVRLVECLFAASRFPSRWR